MSEYRPGELVVGTKWTPGGPYTLIFKGGRELDVPQKVFEVTMLGDRWPGMERREQKEGQQ